jgi:hypothetical protein
MTHKIEEAKDALTIQNQTDMDILEEEKDIVKLVDIVKRQAEINEKIISVLSSSNIPKKDKQEMIDMIGFGKINMGLSGVSSAPKISEVSINEAIPPKGDIKDPFNKFKNMIAILRAKIDKSIAFRDPANPDWYEVGYQTSIKIGNDSTKSILGTIVSFFNNTKQKVTSFIERVKDTKENIETRITLIGEKKNVRNLEKKFKKLFDLLGLEPKELLHSNVFDNNLNKDELSVRISSIIEKSFGAKKQSVDDQYSFGVLEGLTPGLKLEMLNKMIWPNLITSIKEIMKLNNEIESNKNDNKYMEIVVNFSKGNNFSPDLVIHSLKNNPGILEGYPGSEKIMKNKSKIIENADKFEKVVYSNFVYLRELTTVGLEIESLANKLNVDPKMKEDFLNQIRTSNVFGNNNEQISFEQLKKNIIDVEASQANENINIKRAN